MAAELEGRRITTIETEDDAAVAALRRAFVVAGGLQCGFCTPGMILAASRLPTDADPGAIRAGLAGNLCRCTGYVRIVAAVQQAQRRHRRPGKGARRGR
jgi:carbon-monoxide dehydrogenase small subunit